MTVHVTVAWQDNAAPVHDYATRATDQPHRLLFERLSHSNARNDPLAIDRKNSIIPASLI
jgi:hypothetical protein